jgi:hypothetical protein
MTGQVGSAWHALATWVFQSIEADPGAICALVAKTDMRG